MPRRDLAAPTASIPVPAPATGSILNSRSSAAPAAGSAQHPRPRQCPAPSPAQSPPPTPQSLTTPRLHAPDPPHCVALARSTTVSCGVQIRHYMRVYQNAAGCRPSTFEVRQPNGLAIARRAVVLAGRCGTGDDRYSRRVGSRGRRGPGWPGTDAGQVAGPVVVPGPGRPDVPAQTSRRADGRRRARRAGRVRGAGRPGGSSRRRMGAWSVRSGPGLPRSRQGRPTGMCGGCGRVGCQIQPRERASWTASWRLAAPSLAAAEER